jgi:type II secretory pathway predicted ATPase ExeA
MYEAFFNLKNKPFSLLPDPEFLFLSSRHAIGLSLLEYSLTGQAGFCVITGEIGSGKTTLVRAFLERIGREFTVGLISNTHHALKDIAAWGLASFGQKAAGTHPSETYQQLMEYLIAEYGAGRQCILIVDEAQNLSIEVLEELRLLSNINSGKDLLLQVVLVGQPELLDKLKRPELSQFAQRIAISHHLTPLPFPETRRYIEHRVKIAGSDRPLFTDMAIGAIQYFSGGIPRLINSICDMALVYGFADEKQVIGEDLVFRVVSDRQLSGIAPFAQSVPVDDPSVRAEIMKLANLGAAASESPAPAEAPKSEPATERATTPEGKKTTAPKTEPALIVPARIPASETLEVAAKMPEATQRAVEPIQAAPMTAPVAARAVEAAPPMLTRVAPMAAPTTASEVEAAPVPVKPAPIAAPAAARQGEAAPPMLTRVAPMAAPTTAGEVEAAPVPVKPASITAPAAARQGEAAPPMLTRAAPIAAPTAAGEVEAAPMPVKPAPTTAVAAAEVEAAPVPIKAAPMPVPAAREVEAVPVLRANPYFFREQEEEEEEEELLLTVEVNDSSANTHKLIAGAPSATAHASTLERNEPHLGPTRSSEDAVAAPNQAHAAEGSAKPVVEPAPWPSISDRRLGAPIPQKEHGTGTPPRRSWWRRSIGHNS